MDKNNNILILIGLIAFILIAVNIGIFASQNPTSITRVMPSSVSPGSSFTVKYTAVGGSGSWGVSIEDSVSGGCTPTNVKTAFTSPQTYAPITFKAPSSGSCKFHGDYKFGTESVKNMADKTITISEVTPPPNGNGVECTAGQTKCVGTNYYVCSNNYWINQGEVDGKCGYTIEEDEEVPSFDLNRVLFKLGDFEVTLLIILIIFGALFAYSLVKKR